MGCSATLLATPQTMKSPRMLRDQTNIILQPRLLSKNKSNVSSNSTCTQNLNSTDSSSSNSQDSPTFSLLTAIDENNQNFIFRNRTNFDQKLLTPLIYSIQQGKSELANLLLNQQNPIFKGTTALIESVKMDFAQLILQLKSELRRVDSDGNTALIHAVKLGRNELMIFLGAEIGIANRSGKCALDYAVENFNKEAIQFLGAEKNGYKSIIYLVALLQMGTCMEVLDLDAITEQQEPIHKVDYHHQKNLERQLTANSFENRRLFSNSTLNQSAILEARIEDFL